MTFELTVDDVLREFERKIYAPAQVREPGQLAANVGRPHATAFGADVYPTITGKAAALFHGFATTQAFVDGNKRIAVYATVSFLLLNGYRLDLGNREMYDIAMSASNGEMNVDGIAAAFAPAVSELPLDL